MYLKAIEKEGDFDNSRIALCQNNGFICAIYNNYKQCLKENRFKSFEYIDGIIFVTE